MESTETQHTLAGVEGVMADESASTAVIDIGSLAAMTVGELDDLTASLGQVTGEPSTEVLDKCEQWENHCVWM